MDESKTRVGETFPKFNLGPLEAGPYTKPAQTPCELIRQWRVVAAQEPSERAAVFYQCARELAALYNKP